MCENNIATENKHSIAKYIDNNGNTVSKKQHYTFPMDIRRFVSSVYVDVFSSRQQLIAKRFPTLLPRDYECCQGASSCQECQTDLPLTSFCLDWRCGLPNSGHKDASVSDEILECILFLLRLRGKF